MPSNFLEAVTKVILFFELPKISLSFRAQPEAESRNLFDVDGETLLALRCRPAGASPRGEEGAFSMSVIVNDGCGIKERKEKLRH